MNHLTEYVGGIVMLKLSDVSVNRRLWLMQIMAKLFFGNIAIHKRKSEYITLVRSAVKSDSRG
jgi:hypothetical protein